MARPLFEFSGACAGCGETPYIKLLTQLFGDRLLIANATGCSSIYGGNLPTTPYFKIEMDAVRPGLIPYSKITPSSGSASVFRSTNNKNSPANCFIIFLLWLAGISRPKFLMPVNVTRPTSPINELRVASLKQKLESLSDPRAKRLLAIADTLVRKSVWIVGGDGWGYDIGYGGLDHVLASGRNVKVLLLDTEVYSNTGGQCSKSTPRAAVANSLPLGNVARKRISD